MSGVRIVNRVAIPVRIEGCMKVLPRRCEKQNINDRVDGEHFQVIEPAQCLFRENIVLFGLTS